jgi:hypothetical protein
MTFPAPEGLGQYVMGLAKPQQNSAYHPEQGVRDGAATGRLQTPEGLGNKRIDGHVGDRRQPGARAPLPRMVRPSRSGLAPRSEIYDSYRLRQEHFASLVGTFGAPGLDG